MHYQRGNCHRQSCSRRNQRFRNTAGKCAGIARTLRHDLCKDLDHADYGAQQPKQRRNGGNGAQRVQVALQLMHNVARSILDALFHHIATVAGIGEAGRKYAPERGRLAQAAQALAVQLPCLELFPYRG